MEGHKIKINMLMAEINRLKEENQRLNSTLKRMIIKYNDLGRHIRFLMQQRAGVDGNQVFSPDLSGIVSHQSDQYWDYHERGGEREKNAKFIGDQQLHSKKRNIETGITSTMDDSPSCEEKSPKKKYQALSRGSDEPMAAAPRRIVSVQTRSESSLISDGCRWRKYGQKMTRSNTHPRSYYKCAMMRGCPVKKQVQRCAEDPTIVITTYEDEHIHPLSPLAIAFIHASTNQPLTWSPSPTITLNLTDNQLNPAIHLQPAHLATGSFQNLAPLSNEVRDNQNQLSQSSITDFVASIKTDPTFTAALAVAIAGSMLKLRAPIDGMPKNPPATQCADVEQLALAFV